MRIEDDNRDVAYCIKKKGLFLLVNKFSYSTAGGLSPGWCDLREANRFNLYFYKKSLTLGNLCVNIFKPHIMGFKFGICLHLS